MPLLLRESFAPSPPARLGVAVSGGSDSTALLVLLADWAAEGGPALMAATVDHGLRPEAATEAEAVARLCAQIGVPHTILSWRGWDGRGNLPDQARRARYRLLGDWAERQDISAVALGHTRDDQAETFLLRLLRGSGVDGLSGIAPCRRQDGIDWWRPLLAARRETLRDYLRERGLGWVDDPSNDDPGYDRVQVRRLLAAMQPLGLTPDALIATAGRMRLAREALSASAHDLARKIATIEAGDVIFDRMALAAAPEETRLRLLAHALCWISSADYRPRFSALKAVTEQALAGKRASLHGCLILPRSRTLRLTREAAAVAGCETPPEALWDGRWRLRGPEMPGQTIRMLGEAGLAQCPGWRALGLPRVTQLAGPALWCGTALVAAPLAGWPAGWCAELHHGQEDFFTGLIVH